MAFKFQFFRRERLKSGKKYFQNEEINDSSECVEFFKEYATQISCVCYLLLVVKVKAKIVLRRITLNS